MKKYPKKILFVDDDKVLLHVGELILSGMGHDVECFIDGNKAIKRYLNDPLEFDLVITDLNMPNISGSELIQEIISVRPDAKTILCSGTDEDICSEIAIEMGATAFVSKPFKKKVIEETVTQILYNLN